MAPLSSDRDLDGRRLRDAFGVFPSGVVAVAAVVDGVPLGLAASSFTSVSLEPPLVSFSVAVTSKTWPELRRAGRLGVTVLAEHHGDVCRQLAGPVESRFDGLALSISEDGAVTLDEGVAQFDCTIYDEVRRGTTWSRCWSCTPPPTRPAGRWSSTAPPSAGSPADSCTARPPRTRSAAPRRPFATLGSCASSSSAPASPASPRPGIWPLQGTR